MNWYKTSQSISFLKMLNNLKPLVTNAAQEIYDEWEQDNQGIDMEYGCGGICYEISIFMGLEILHVGVGIYEGRSLRRQRTPRILFMLPLDGTA